MRSYDIPLSSLSVADIPVHKSATRISVSNSEYYAKGSVELATETPVTLTRLATRQRLTKNSTRLVIALVGLPARGKSFVSRKLLYYLNWTGCKCKIFNVGKYRREAYAESLVDDPAGGEQGVGSPTGNESRAKKGSCDASFFDANNEAAAKLRERVAEIALNDMLSWLDEEEEDEGGDSCLWMDSTRHSSTSFSLCGTRHSRSPSSPDRTEHSTASSSIGGQPKLNWKQFERVAIFDATNSTDKRRQWILEMCTAPHRRVGKPTGVVFVESLCDDEELLNENYRYKISVSPDFDGMSKEEAMEDLRIRVRKYEEQYETITNDSLSYIKVFNLSTKLLCNHIYGRMAKELVPALMAWHIGTRPVFLCRPGQTVSGILTDGEDYVARSKVNPMDPRFLDMSRSTRKRNLRGDSLGESGAAFRKALLDLCYEEAHSFMFQRASVRDMAYTGTSLSGLASTRSIVPSDSADGENPDQREPFPLRILTSTMTRAIDTVNWEEFDFHLHQMSNLNPLDKGDFAGMELDEIKVVNPIWYEKLVQDPFDTRFSGGESYRDLIRRVGSVVIEIEQQVIPTLVVSHVSILQALMAYFRNSRIENCMSIEVPLHTVIKYTPVRGGGWMEEIIPLTDLSPVVGNDGEMVEVPSSSDVSELELEEHPSPIWGDHVGRSRLYSADLHRTRRSAPSLPLC